MCFFFFKQKTAYELRISDWSSDLCSSVLRAALLEQIAAPIGRLGLVAHHMRQRRFGNIACVTGLLADPVAERRAEPVHRVGLLHLLEELGHGHVRDGKSVV